MKQKLLHTLSVLLIPVLLLSGCWEDDLPEEDDAEELIPFETETPDPEPDDSLPVSFSLPYDPSQTLDPITCSDGMQQVVGSLVYEGLFHLDHSMKPQPVLCSRFTYDAETLTYIFQIRPGVLFADGSPLTAEDVKATLDRARKSTRYGARLSQVSRISASGDTVTVTLVSPNTSFPALLDIPIVKAGTHAQPAPVGTGPYMIALDSSSAKLVANQTWWQGSGQPLDRILLTEASDWDTMLYRFTSHDVQLITADLISEQSVTSAGNIVFRDSDTTAMHFIGCNTAKAPLDDPALRSALWSSFSRSTVISAFLSGHGKAAQFPVSPASPLYPAQLEQRYAKDSFSALLADAGYSGGRTLTLLVNSENPFKVSVADFIAKSMTEGGVPVVVKALPWDGYLAALSSGSFDLYYGEVRLTADWDLRPLLSPGGALNYTGWTDPQTEQLLQSYLGSQEPALAMEKLCKRLKSQAPIIPICFASSSVLMHSGVIDGLEPTAAEPFYRPENITIHLQK